MRIAGTEITFTFHYVSINTVGGTGGEGGADIFTFHYVSINTSSLFKKIVFNSSFTFHYVSINTGYDRWM